MSDNEMFWVVWNPESGPPSFRHRSRNEARSEATRLARQNPGQEFFVLAAIGRAHRPEPTIFQTLTPPSGVDDDEIPF